MRLRAATICVLASCGSTDPAPGPVIERPAPAPSMKPRAAAWELSLRSDYGPCEETDKRSCHQTWTVTPDGAISKFAVSNDPKQPPTVTTFTMSLFDRDQLRALVAGHDFRDGIEHGFPCQGGRDPDATLTLTFADPNTSLRGSQHVEMCTRGPDADKTLPTKIIGLVRR